jgi:hypothetical protein
MFIVIHNLIYLEEQCRFLKTNLSLTMEPFISQKMELRWHLLPAFLSKESGTGPTYSICCILHIGCNKYKTVQFTATFLNI